MHKGGLRYSLMQASVRAKRAVYSLLQAVAGPVWHALLESNFNDGIMLVVVSSKLCNSDCVFCPYQFSAAGDRQLMGDEVFSRVAQEIRKAGITRVHFTSNSGDPLVDAGILLKMRRLREAGVEEIRLTTNAIAADKIGCRQLLEEGPDVITISTAPFSEEVYRRIFRNDQFGRMRQNVLELLRLNRTAHKRRKISLLVHTDIPKDQVLAMPEMAEVFALADEVAISDEYDNWLGAITPGMLHGSMRFTVPVPVGKRPCQVLATMPAVYPNGDITGCACRNFRNDPELYLGNIITGGLQPALDTLKRLCLQWGRGKVPQMCRVCSMYGDPAYYLPDFLRSVVRKRVRHGNKDTGAA